MGRADRNGASTDATCAALDKGNIAGLQSPTAFTPMAFDQPPKFITGETLPALTFGMTISMLPAKAMYYLPNHSDTVNNSGTPHWTLTPHL